MEGQMAMTLAHLPPMDDVKIGPAGETFGELKQRVIEERAAFTECLMAGEVPVVTKQRLDEAVKMLRAAYIRVGLPYRAP